MTPKMTEVFDFQQWYSFYFKFPIDLDYNVKLIQEGEGSFATTLLSGDTLFVK